MTSGVLTILGALAGAAAFVTAFVGARKSRSEIQSTTATATKSNADAAGALNATLVDQIKLAKDAAADARAATAAMEDVLGRLSAVMRLLDELPDDARLGSIRGRLIAALRGPNGYRQLDQTDNLTRANQRKETP